MTKTFNNLPELTVAMAYDLIDMIKAHEFGDIEVFAEFGLSNISPSAYVEFSAVDEDGDTVVDTKIRFSDHADRYGSDLTVRIDDLIVTIEEDGEYIETQISDENYAEALNRAFAHIKMKVTA